MRKDKNSSTIVCSWCRDNGESTISVGNCKECDLDLCGECINGHNRMPPFRNHTIEMTQTLAQSENLLCEMHPRETLELYCEKCNLLTCRNCQLSEHREHGGHSWVGEKAASLKPKLKHALEALIIENSGLEFSLVKMEKALTDNGDFRKSANKAIDSINLKCEKMKKSIEMYSKKLIEEINDRVSEYNKKITSAEDVTKMLQAQIEFTTSLTNSLLQNVDKDPASLVQLSDSLISRIEFLLSKAMDVSSDKNRQNSIGSGWSDVLHSRVYYLENKDIDELLAMSGVISWSMESTGRKVVPKDISGEPDSTSKNDSRDNDSFVTLIDTMTDFENTERPSKTCCCICHLPGIMATCSECKLCFHVNCHLPRLESLNKLDNNWKCSSCNDSIDDYTLSSDVYPNELHEFQLKPAEFLKGCRILIKLMLKPEFTYFIYSNCPKCGISVSNLLSLTSDAINNSTCKANLIFHEIFRLRRKLEYSDARLKFSLPSKKETDQVKSLCDWISELRCYFKAVNNSENNQYITPGTKKAAVSLDKYLENIMR